MRLMRVAGSVGSSKADLIYDKCYDERAGPGVFLPCRRRQALSELLSSRRGECSRRVPVYCLSVCMM